MDGAGIAIAIFVTIGIVLLSIVACGSICCCCCAIPIFRIIWNMFFPPKPTYQVSTVQSGNSRREYELVNSSGVESGGYQHRLGFSEPLHEDVVMAEAYLVPPLAEVVGVNSSNTEAPPTGDDANRIHELQVLTNENKEGGFRDSWAAVLFIANVLIIIYLFVQSIYLLKSESSTGTNTEEQDSTYDLGLIRTIAAFIILLTVIAAGLGSFVLSILIQHSENLIEMVMWSNIAIQGFCAIMCLLSLQIIGAVIFGVLAGLNYWYLISVRSQIPFSSTVLATACTAVKANYTGLLTTAFSALFVQMLWGLVWIIAVIGVLYATEGTDTGSSNTTRYLSTVSTSTTSSTELNLQSKHSDDYHYTVDDTHTDDEDSSESSLRGLYMFLLFVSLYWGVQVTKAVVQTTVAGTLACWWFQPQREAPVRGSLLRAMTTSFGSLCLGSLIVAILQAIREMIQAMRRQALNRRDERERSFLLECFLSIANILLEWIEQAVQYFNKYAYCYVAAYGLSFLQSGRLVTGLFTSRGWTAIINDNLISNALTCGVIALGVATMVCGVLLSFLFDLAVASNIGEMGTLALIGGITGLVAGVIVGMVLTNALDSAVAMVFVCFAESPQALQKNHPEVYADLRSKWDSMYPSSLSWLGGGGSRGGSPVPVAHSSAGSSGYHAPPSAYTYSTGDYSTHSAYNPSSSSPYNAGYAGYGGYGPSTTGGSGYQAQSSPGSAVYNPHYQHHLPPQPSAQYHPAGYPPAGYAAAPHPYATATAPPAAVVAHPVSTAGNGHTAVHGGKNLPPSAPPGGY